MSETTPSEPKNGYENVKSVKRVDALEIENLPSGQFSRLFIEVVENGIGRSIQVPVVVARGKKDSPEARRFFINQFGYTCCRL